MSGSSSVGRASAFQAECREFEPRLPLHIISDFRPSSSVVERILGKDEVTGSIPVLGLSVFIHIKLLTEVIKNGEREI